MCSFYFDLYYGIDSVPQAPKIQMIEGFPHKLRTWWENFNPSKKLAIAKGWIPPYVIRNRPR